MLFIKKDETLGKSLFVMGRVVLFMFFNSRNAIVNYLLIYIQKTL